MKYTQFFKIIGSILIAGFLLSACSNTTVYLVRHADRIDNQDALSPEGFERAEDLKTRLSEAGIQVVFSSDYQRTKDTATPIANHLGLTLQLYDASDIPRLVKLIKSQYKNKTVLVVGHSNTTPEVANEFGVRPILKIIPHGTYGRLYMLKVKNDGTVAMALSHYGNTNEE